MDIPPSLSLNAYLESTVQNEVLTNRKVSWEQIVLLADQYNNDHICTKSEVDPNIHKTNYE